MFKDASNFGTEPTPGGGPATAMLPELTGVVPDENPAMTPDIIAERQRYNQEIDEILEARRARTDQLRQERLLNRERRRLGLAAVGDTLHATDGATVDAHTEDPCSYVLEGSTWYIETLLSIDPERIATAHKENVFAEEEKMWFYGRTQAVREASACVFPAGTTKQDVENIVQARAEELITAINTGLAQLRDEVREELAAGGAIDPVATLALYEQICTNGRLGIDRTPDLKGMLRRAVNNPAFLGPDPKKLHVNQSGALLRALDSIGVFADSQVVLSMHDPNHGTKSAYGQVKPDQATFALRWVAN